MYQQKFAAPCFNYSFPHVHYSYSYNLWHLKFYTLQKKRYHHVALFLIVLALALSSALLVWKLLVFQFLLVIAEAFLCSMFVPLLKFVLLVASAAYIISRDADVFGIKTVSLSYCDMGPESRTSPFIENTR
jgi:hypothetical protein